MKKLLFILLLLPLFAFPQAEKPYRSIIIDSIKALNGGIIDIKDFAKFDSSVSIGGSANITAILTMVSTKKGLLTPRMTTAQRDAIPSPATGLMIYNIDDGEFQFFDGSWSAIGGGVADSSFVTLQVDTVKSFNNATIQFNNETEFNDFVRLSIVNSGAIANSDLTIGGVVSGAIRFGTDNSDFVGIGFSATTMSFNIQETTTAEFSFRGSGASGLKIIIDNPSNRTVLQSLLRSMEYKLGVSSSTAAGHSFFTKDVTNTLDIERFVVGNRLDDVDCYFININGLGINQTTPAAMLHVKGIDATSANSALLVEDNVGTKLFIVKNDGNIGIGTSSPAASAILDITSTIGAVLFPRMTTAQRDALTAVNGMVIYNSTLDKLQVRAGGAWISLH